MLKIEIQQQVENIMQTEWNSARSAANKWASAMQDLRGL